MENTNYGKKASHALGIMVSVLFLWAVTSAKSKGQKPRTLQTVFKWVSWREVIVKLFTCFFVDVEEWGEWVAFWHDAVAQFAGRPFIAVLCADRQHYVALRPVDYV